MNHTQFFKKLGILKILQLLFEIKIPNHKTKIKIN